MIRQVVCGGPGHTNFYREFIISSTSDVSNLPVNTGDTIDECDPGSIAYTQDMSHMYVLGNDYTWREVV